MTSNTFWANAERKTTEIDLKDKRNLTPAVALSQTSCKSKGWPDQWKPYIIAWKRFQGKIETSSSWPWQLEEIKVGDIGANEFSVKKALAWLYKGNTNEESSYNWLSQKWTLNKKKDLL